MSTLCAYHLRLGTVRLGTVRLGLVRLGTVKLVLVLVQQGMIGTPSHHTCRCRSACSLSLSAPAGYNTPWNRTECSVRTECAHCTLCAHFLGYNTLCTNCIHTVCVSSEFRFTSVQCVQSVHYLPISDLLILTLLRQGMIGGQVIAHVLM